MEISADNKTITCRSGGQPIVLKKIVKPRKTSGQANSPLKKKRAKLLQNLGEELAGKSGDNSMQQQGSELKHARKTARRKS